jgi:hypothetical protein
VWHVEEEERLIDRVMDRYDNLRRKPMTLW